MPTNTTPVKPLEIDEVSIKNAASIYRAIYHPLRLQIIEIIHKAGKLNVTPIIRKLKLEQSLVSAQLKILRDAHFLKIERDGRNIYYTVNYDQINHVSRLTEQLIPKGSNGLGSVQTLGRKFIFKTERTGGVLFTPTELTIIRLVCEQNTSDDIAQKIGLSKRTVEDYRSSIIKKMKVRNSVGILIFAVKNGLFKL